MREDILIGPQNYQNDEIKDIETHYDVECNLTRVPDCHNNQKRYKNDF
jgi:hypothetical protein